MKSYLVYLSLFLASFNLFGFQYEFKTKSFLATSSNQEKEEPETLSKRERRQFLQQQNISSDLIEQLVKDTKAFQRSDLKEMIATFRRLKNNNEEEKIALYKAFYLINPSPLTEELCFEAFTYFLSSSELKPTLTFLSKIAADAGLRGDDLYQIIELAGKITNNERQISKHDLYIALYKYLKRNKKNVAIRDATARLFVVNHILRNQNISRELCKHVVDVADNTSYEGLKELLNRAAHHARINQNPIQDLEMALALYSDRPMRNLIIIRALCDYYLLKAPHLLSDQFVANLARLLIARTGKDINQLINTVQRAADQRGETVTGEDITEAYKRMDVAQNLIASNSYLALVPTVDLPSIDMIFGKKVPTVIEHIIRALKDPEAWSKQDPTRTLPMPEFLLFYGPPGTGKTTAAELIGRKAERQILYVSGSDFAAKYVGETSDRLRQVFTEAESYHSPVIILIDEFDAIAQPRTEDSKNTEVRETFIKMLNKYKDSKNIYIIVTTNNYKLLDQAIKDRFTSIELRLPDRDMRCDIIHYYLQLNGIHISSKSSGYSDSEIGWHVGGFLIAATAGFSQRDIAVWINRAYTSSVLKMKITHNDIARSYLAWAHLYQEDDRAEKYIGSPLWLILGPIISKELDYSRELRSPMDKYFYQTFLEYYEDFKKKGIGNTERNKILLQIALGGALTVGGVYFAIPAGATAASLAAGTTAKTTVTMLLGQTVMQAGQQVAVHGINQAFTQNKQ